MHLSKGDELLPTVNVKSNAIERLIMLTWHFLELDLLETCTKLNSAFKRGVVHRTVSKYCS